MDKHLPLLTSPLAEQIEQAFDQLTADRIGVAAARAESLIVQAQENHDRAAEICTRSLLARCLIRRGLYEKAVEQLDFASTWLHDQPDHVLGAYHAARVRLIRATDGDGHLAALRSYLDWATTANQVSGVLDACEQLAQAGDLEAQVHWLTHALAYAQTHAHPGSLAALHNALGVALQALGQPVEALHAYQDAVSEQYRTGSPKSQAMACWVVGAVAIHLEDWPLAETRLNEAVQLASQDDEAHKVLPLALGALARVHEAAGDVVEAHRLLLRAIDHGRKFQLERLMPQPWQDLLDYCEQLELNT